LFRRGIIGFGIIPLSSNTASMTAFIPSNVSIAVGINSS
jgi:hypothetical protein